MTRLVERWFPCSEVSDASGSGWGSGNVESSLWVWFAKRPVAQSKAAVLTSLLPWPDDEAEQDEIRQLVRRALTGYRADQSRIESTLLDHYGQMPAVLDPFSGRGMIPLEAGRLGARSWGVDYSPFVTLGGALLADLIHRDWSEEPPLQFASDSGSLDVERRIVGDSEAFLNEVGRRFTEAMNPLFPKHNGAFPWGYLWASTIPCEECGRRFPLVGELRLRLPRPPKGDPGQSFYLDADVESGDVHAVVHDGPPTGTPTRVLAGKSKYSSNGRVAVCPFCSHVHIKAVHTRLSLDGERRDMLLVAADIADDGTKVFRAPTPDEVSAAQSASSALSAEPSFGIMPARPNESIPAGNTRTIQSVNYGDTSYGDLMEDRQTLTFVRLCRAINEVSDEILKAGMGQDYVRALAGLATAAMMRKMRRATRGARLQITGGTRVGDLFVNQSAVSFSYDWFESGLSDGPGSWNSLATQTVTGVRNIITRGPARPAAIERGDATHLPFRDAMFDAVVMDPPYDDMIDYSDSSDLFYVWAKRAMLIADPSLGVTAHPAGVQEKDREAIVKRGGSQSKDPRTKKHYDALVTEAFSEARRVVKPDGVVTIVFGHGDPDVWHRFVGAIVQAGLVMTGSWPAKTESSGGANSANIVTTLTMTCRPASANRPVGRRGTVETAIKAEVRKRYPDWERWGLAPTDMLMASAGPAMEIVGQYSEVLDARGEVVDPAAFLPLARAAVQEAMAVEVDHHPLETFDARTRFALWWIRLFGRELAAKSELRWQALAASLELDDIRDLVPDADSGVRFVTSTKFKSSINSESAVVDVALALAAVSDQGRPAMGMVLADSVRDPQDAYLWSAVKFLADRLPDNDPDSIAFNRVMRARDGIASAAEAIEVAVVASDHERERRDQQVKLF